MADVLNVAIRKEDGTKRMRRLRASGQVPAVLYGHKEAAVSLQLTATEVMAVVKHGGKVVNLKGGLNESALVREVQWDVWGKSVIHMDLMRVSAGDRVTTSVSVEGKGAAPGSTEGGIVEWVSHEIEIECPAMSVPDVIIIRLEKLHLDGAIHAREVPLPEGAKLLTDPEAVLVHCVAPRTEEVPTPTGETVEPEIIKKEKKEEGEADAK